MSCLPISVQFLASTQEKSAKITNSGTSLYPKSSGFERIKELWKVNGFRLQSEVVAVMVWGFLWDDPRIYMLQLIRPSCFVVSIRAVFTCSMFFMVLSVSKVTDAKPNAPCQAVRLASSPPDGLVFQSKRFVCKSLDNQNLLKTLVIRATSLAFEIATVYRLHSA
jgi:hypothetical protein